MFKLQLILQCNVVSKSVLFSSMHYTISKSMPIFYGKLPIASLKKKISFKNVCHC